MRRDKKLTLTCSGCLFLGLCNRENQSALCYVLGRQSFAICCPSAVPISHTQMSFIKYFAFPSFIENQNFLYFDNKNVKKMYL